MAAGLWILNIWQLGRCFLSSLTFFKEKPYFITTKNFYLWL